MIVSIFFEKLNFEKDGNIIYQTSGTYSDDKLNDITGALLN